MFYLEALKNKILNYSEYDQEQIVKAFHFAEEAHREQVRKSGEAYIMHPVAVACMLADMKLDRSSVMTGLLHDTVEDTPVTLEDIEKQFGKEISYLVAGVTKLKKIALQSDRMSQAENLRKLVLAMSEDIRVLIVKLTDRLHNMRTLFHVSSDLKRRRIALETMEIYAPLAERIGMNYIHEELQNLSFAELNTQAYESIVKRLRAVQRDGEKVINEVIEDLENTLSSVNIQAKIFGREKTPYSIWKKMHLKNVSFEQLSDVYAFRVIVDSVADCYQTLGAIHNRYVVLPGRIKDYISTPKPNHYQSLHTTVIGPNQGPVEIQIRTKQMHAISEYGVAAHWEYKQQVQSKDGRQYRWLRGLLEILENTSGAEEFLEHTKLEMYQDQVFCFTPSGDLVSLPKGATCIDFAYAVHSDIGNKCTGSKINGRLVPLRTELENGDQVEIITSPNHEPSPAWERFVVTGKARASIRKYIRIKQRSQFLKLGEAILRKALHKHKVSPSDNLLKPILPKFKESSVEDLYVAIGNGEYTGHEVVSALYPEKPDADAETIEPTLAAARKYTKEKKKAHEIGPAIAIKGLIPGMAIHYAGCCHPLPGDKICGVVMSGKGVTVHTLDCDVLDQYEKQPERLLDISWDETENDEFVGRLSLEVSNTPGNLGTIATLIGTHDSNIINLKIVRRASDYFELLVDLAVQNTEHLNTIMASLRSSACCHSVKRV